MATGEGVSTALGGKTKVLGFAAPKAPILQAKTVGPSGPRTLEDFTAQSEHRPMANGGLAHITLCPTLHSPTHILPPEVELLGQLLPQPVLNQGPVRESLLESMVAQVRVTSYSA